jgi:large exoprotein involved in heme utilization and adhesion
VAGTSAGSGGNLQINTRRLSVQNGARLTAASRTQAPLNPASQGKAGNVTIRASEEVEIIGPALTQISASTEGAGSAGDVSIETGRLIARDGGQVVNSTFGAGGAGKLTVNADEVELIGRSADSSQPSGLLARVENPATGSGGNLQINTRRLSVENGARVAAASRGQGAAGTVKIQASETVEVSIAEVSVRGRQIPVRQDNLSVVAPFLRLDSQGSLAADSPEGIGGNITLQARDIQLRRGSQISATPGGSAPEGNIKIQTETLVLLEASRIISQAVNLNPQGGSNVSIVPPEGKNLVLFQSPDSIINASGQLSIQGNIQFSSPDVPQVKVVDPAEQIAQNPCTRGEGSEFIITGSGGLPPSPNDALSSDAVRVGLVEPAPSQNTVSLAERQIASQTAEHPPISHAQFPNPIVPARGWAFNSKGEVILTAYNSAGSLPERPWPKPAGCR